LKALPARMQPAWYKAVTDPDGKVHFELTALTGAQHLEIMSWHATAKSTDSNDVAVDQIGLIMDRIAASLTGLKGLTDADTGEDLLLETEQRGTIKLLKKEVLNRLPPNLLGEITGAVHELTTLSEVKRKAVDFTSRSSKQKSRAKEMKKRASTGARKAN